MKKQKKIQNTVTNVVATGVFKKRKWPWLFVLAAAIIPAVFYATLAVEFFWFKKCGVGHVCQTYYAYTFHYEKPINSLLILIGILLLLAILCAILFIRKRKLTLTGTYLIYQKGRKINKIPLSSIEEISGNASSITIKVPFKKLKFAKLINKKEFCDLLIALVNAPATPIAAVRTTKGPKPTIAESKIQYFQSLLAAGVITDEQFSKYTNTVLTTSFPTLY